MVIGIKDALKFIGISVISCCAVLVCTMFFNFYLDIAAIENEIVSEEIMLFYNAQVSTSKVVCFVSGGCLLVTSVIMLVFYIRYYIDAHKKELGILKALGYSDRKIAGHFYVFAVSVLIGTSAGFALSFAIMPFFYRLQNEDKILPEFTIGFHPSIFIYFVVIPTALFALLSVVYAYIKLKMPVISLLKDNVYTQSNPKKTKTEKNTDRPFIDDLKRNTLKTKKTLVFFSIFSAFCFSAMMQMSYSMIDLSSEMMAAMIMIIGIILSCVTLFLAVTTVINGNTKTIAMMRVFGYSQKECCNALLGGYRPLAYIGFAAGTVYQYALLRVMVDVVFKNIENVPLYEFNFKAMLVTLICFAVIYELVMYFYSERIKKISVKEIMLE